MRKIIKQIKNQKQSTGASSPKGARGKYQKRLAPEVKTEIIQILNEKKRPLESVAIEFKRNKETIRSIQKNQNKESLYKKLVDYLKRLYLNQFKSQNNTRQQIKKVIKQYIKNQDEHPQLQKLIEEINNKRQISKNAKSGRIIRFNANNRRILDKVVGEILSDETADTNNTVSSEVYWEERVRFDELQDSTPNILFSGGRRNRGEID